MLADVVAVLPFSPNSVRTARSIVRDCGRELPVALMDDAELLVSEVVTNALVHGGPAVTLSVAADDVSITVRVSDFGEGRPIMSPPGVRPDQPSGRGLQLVHQLSAEWGIDAPSAKGEKSVWFRLAGTVRIPRPAGDEPVNQSVEGNTRWS